MLADSQWKQQLLDRIGDGSVRLGVIGLGYVGLPLAEVFARAGVRVTGFDVDPWKVEQIHAGRTYIGDLTDAQIKAQVDEGRLEATTDFDGLAEMDAILICVPTPLRKTLDPDISYIVQAVEEIRSRMTPGKLVVLESTTYPGTTEEIIFPMIAEDGLVLGEDFFLAFSPERVDPSNEKYKTENTPKVVGGSTPSCCDVAKALYALAIPSVHMVSSARAAEMVKLLENTFRLINIGLVNEIALVCEKLGLDVWEIIDAAATKPFGFMPFYPGPGLGGHCIPIDPHYLSWKLRSLNYFTRFIDVASEINRGMPEHVVERLTLLLNDRAKPIRGSKIMALGVAYKKDCADLRESPALDVMLMLKQRGAELAFHDPYVEEMELDGETLAGLPCDAETLASQDAVIVLTDHSSIDYAKVVASAPLVYDTRNATRAVAEGADHVVRL
jgi:UDP-N-acetyl-D-glucosamine dehydrogenase